MSMSSSGRFISRIYLDQPGYDHNVGEAIRASRSVGRRALFLKALHRGAE
jgi:hypothetical protein